jgi:hypothetical protein
MATPVCVLCRPAVLIVNSPRASLSTLQGQHSTWHEQQAQHLNVYLLTPFTVMNISCNAGLASKQGRAVITNCFFILLYIYIIIMMNCCAC